MNVWPLALRNVARNRRRSLLTGAVIAFGFAAMALAGGFMAQTFSGLRRGTIRNGTGHLQFAPPGFFDGAGESVAGPSFGAASRASRLLRSDPQVVAVLPRIDLLGLVTDGSRSVPFMGTGLDPAPEARTMEYASLLSAGSWLDGRDDPRIVLGSGLARALGVEVGDDVTLLATTPEGVLNAVDATVAGLASIPIKELDDRYLATSLGLGSNLLQLSDQVSKLVVVLQEGVDVEAARDRLLARLRQAGIFVEARTWEELALFYRQVRLLYLGIFGFMGLILVVVVLLAVANTMIMATAERTREMGALRALGTRSAIVERMFLAEGALLALGGCIVGALASLTIRWLLNHSGIVLPPPPGVSRGMPLHVELFAAAYAAGALAMEATVIVAAYLPARRAARMPIVEALTHT